MIIFDNPKKSEEEGLFILWIILLQKKNWFINPQPKINLHTLLNTTLFLLGSTAMARQEYNYPIYQFKNSSKIAFIWLFLINQKNLERKDYSFFE